MPFRWAFRYVAQAVVELQQLRDAEQKKLLSKDGVVDGSFLGEEYFFFFGFHWG